MRHFLRHPSELPVELAPRKQSFIPRQRLSNISLGGVACRSPRSFRRGTAVELRIPLLGDQARYLGLVAWCRREKDGYLIGVAFTDHDTLMRASMVEQICQLEQYRKHREEAEGRSLPLGFIVREWSRRTLDAATFDRNSIV